MPRNPSRNLPSHLFFLFSLLLIKHTKTISIPDEDAILQISRSPTGNGKPGGRNRNYKDKVYRCESCGLSKLRYHSSIIPSLSNLFFNCQHCEYIFSIVLLHFFNDRIVSGLQPLLVHYSSTHSIHIILAPIETTYRCH